MKRSSDLKFDLWRVTSDGLSWFTALDEWSKVYNTLDEGVNDITTRRYFSYAELQSRYK
jgi:hypothetical protein